MLSQVQLNPLQVSTLSKKTTKPTLPSYPPGRVWLLSQCHYTWHVLKDAQLMSLLTAALHCWSPAYPSAYHTSHATDYHNTSCYALVMLTAQSAHQHWLSHLQSQSCCQSCKDKMRELDSRTTMWPWCGYAHVQRL
jgi:hypothetical protein